MIVNLSLHEEDVSASLHARHCEYTVPNINICATNFMSTLVQEMSLKAVLEIWLVRSNPPLNSKATW